MKKILAIAIMITFIFACNNQQKPGSISYKPFSVDNAYHLSSTIIIPSDSLISKSISHVKIIDNNIILLGLMNGKWLHMYDNSGQHLSSWCSQGRGPGELIQPGSLGTTDKIGEISVYDMQLNIGYIYSLGAVRSGKMQPLRSVTIPKNTYFTANYSMRIMPNNKLFISGARGSTSNKEGKARYMIMQNEKEIATYGELPAIDDPYIAENILPNMTRMQVSPDASKFATATSCGAIMEIFTLSDSITLSQIKFFLKPEFKKAGQNIDMILGFTGLNVTNDYIFTSYYGKQLPKISDPLIDMRDKIVVFDWSGELRNVFQTDYQIIDFNYCSDDNSIYALAKDGLHGRGSEICLVKIKLPQAFN